MKRLCVQLLFTGLWRDFRASLARNLIRRDCPLGRSLVSVEKAAGEISSTGGHRQLSPLFSGFFRLFLEISKQF